MRDPHRDEDIQELLTEIDKLCQAAEDDAKGHPPAGTAIGRVPLSRPMTAHPRALGDQMDAADRRAVLDEQQQAEIERLRAEVLKLQEQLDVVMIGQITCQSAFAPHPEHGVSVLVYMRRVTKILEFRLADEGKTLLLRMPATSLATMWQNAVSKGLFEPGGRG